MELLYHCNVQCGRPKNHYLLFRHLWTTFHRIAFVSTFRRYILHTCVQNIQHTDIDQRTCLIREKKKKSKRFQRKFNIKPTNVTIILYNRRDRKTNNFVNNARSHETRLLHQTYIRNEYVAHTWHRKASTCFIFIFSIVFV